MIMTPNLDVCCSYKNKTAKLGSYFLFCSLKTFQPLPRKICPSVHCPLSFKQKTCNMKGLKEKRERLC